MHAWRELLAGAPRQATLTADATTAGNEPFLPPHLHGRPVVTTGFAWVGDMAEAQRYLDTFREALPASVAEQASEMTYVELQGLFDEYHHHGKRRYMKGHYLSELSDAAIDAFVSRGIPAGGAEPDWSRMPNGGFQAYGGAIAEVGDDESAFSHREALVEFGASTSWVDPAEDAARMSAARTYAAAVEPFASGVYVNAITDEGEAGVKRAYPPAKLARLAAIKRRYDPDNVFHLNQNIRPAPAP